jgi:hypothetical protein
VLQAVSEPASVAIRKPSARMRLTVFMGFPCWMERLDAGEDG